MSKSTKRACLTILVSGLIVAFSMAAHTPASAAKNYGCYKVVGASSLAIRKGPWLWSPIVGYARRGKILEKSRKFCKLRPWCPVRKGKVEGWSGRAYLEKVDC